MEKSKFERMSVSCSWIVAAAGAIGSADMLTAGCVRTNRLVAANGEASTTLRPPVPAIRVKAARAPAFVARGSIAAAPVPEMSDIALPPMAQAVRGHTGIKRIPATIVQRDELLKCLLNREDLLPLRKMI